MRRTGLILGALLLALICLGSTTQAQESVDSEAVGVIHANILVGERSFPVTFDDNETTMALVGLFPMTVPMTELNGQEKYFNLADELPSDASMKPATIQAGDVMCWSGNCLVLFYKTFANSYGGYVPLGTVDDPSALAEALGAGEVEVTWTLDQSDGAANRKDSKVTSDNVEADIEPIM